jgi:hypothetical protein
MQGPATVVRFLQKGNGGSPKHLRMPLGRYSLSIVTGTFERPVRASEPRTLTVVADRPVPLKGKPQYTIEVQRVGATLQITLLFKNESGEKYPLSDIRADAPAFVAYQDGKRIGGDAFVFG